jgi:hypothetical protein
MILYHFTSAAATQGIISEGVIRPHRGEIGRRLPPVVWLTADPDRRAVFDSHPDDPAVVISTAYRFTVDVPDQDASQWRDWMARHGKGPSLAEADPEVAAYKAQWYILDREIPREEWVAWEWAVETNAWIAALEAVVS